MSLHLFELLTGVKEEGKTRRRKDRRMRGCEDGNLNPRLFESTSYVSPLRKQGPSVARRASPMTAPAIKKPHANMRLFGLAI
ncbi:hypothetical protein J8I26_10850, partial [Herbaspirillum sp. LeCh32-8]|uniref:hypothetical protein n=1 Tax=Herbaspirillum sp. LeCh32-8 TaxID=2821356 RepID=UPI001AE9DBDF